MPDSNSNSIDYAAQTDVGLKRTHNEDAIAIFPESAVTILADGMGGYSAGEVASEIAIAIIEEYVHKKLHPFLSCSSLSYQPDIIQKIVEQAVELANTTILNTALNEPKYFGMGTTLVMSVCCRDKLLVAHVGDSRAYRFRQGRLAQITRDHSVVQEQIDAGILTEESAQYSTIRNLVTRAVGVSYPVEVEINLHQMEAGDIYLLCSDGLSDMLIAQKIQEILRKNNKDIQKMCSELIESANKEGGSDNISVILFKVNDIKNSA